jgi:hypothetical protein
MSGGDGRTESRFRGSYEPNRLPRVAGLCRYCHRQMWTSLPERDRRGKIVVSRDGRTCDPCQRYVRTTGKDPREKAGSAAEMVPAEYPEDDQWWRDSGLPHCAGVGGGPFEPDPLPEELAATPDEEPSWRFRCPGDWPGRAALRHGRRPGVVGSALPEHPR